MKNLICVIYMLFMFFVTSGQSPNPNMYAPQGYSVIPPSPEVASLMKHNEYPVSYFTGQPQINLPIYVVRQGQLEVPISISYHGGGIRMNEHAGIIGLGWSLNAGGCISRTVHGLPDEINRNPIKGLLHMTIYTDSLRNTMLSRQSWNQYSPYSYSNSFVLSQLLCDGYNDGKADVANDIFQINAMGKSGTFAYNIQQNSIVGNPVLSSDSDIKFTYAGGYLGSYRMVDSSGTKYEFDDIEQTRFECSYRSAGISYTDSIYYNSAWHLSRIISAAGDTISFNYANAPFRGESNGLTEKRTFSSNTQIKPNTINIGTSFVYYKPKVLQSIVSRTETVEFVYKDTSYKELSVIRVKNNNGHVVRTDSLQSSTCKLGRLLKRISEVTASSCQKLYEFDYYGEGESASPALSDFSQDEWGYYNGENNTTLIKSFQGNGYTQNLSDRNVNLSCTLPGTLYKITYATGGYTLFDWEQNNYSHIGYQSPFPEQTTSTQHIDYDKSMKIADNVTEPKSIQTVTLGSVSVESGKTKGLTIDISKYFKPLVDSGAPPFAFLPGQSYNQDQTQCNYSDYPHISVVKTGVTNQEVKRIYIDKIQSEIGLHYVSLPPGSYNIFVKYPYNLDEVDNEDMLAYFRLYLNGNNDTYGHIYHTVSETTQSTVYSKSWGGIRLKTISEVPDPTTTQGIHKNLVYKEEIGDQISSGTITENPNYQSTLYFYKRIEENSSGTQSRIVGAEIQERYSNGLYSTPLGGSMVEYPFVWEVYPNDNLSIRHTYDSSRENPDQHDATFYEYLPGGMRMLTSNAHKRGNLLSSEYYNGQLLYKTVSNDYEIIEAGNNPTFLGDLKRIMDADSTNLKDPHDSTQYIGSDYTASRYTIIPYLKRTLSTINEEISGGKTLTDSVEYAYFTDVFSDALSSRFIKSKTIVNSQGKRETTYYKYVSSNLNLPRAEVTVCDGTVVSAKKYEYEKDTDNINGRYVLAKTYTAPMGATLTGYNNNIVWVNLNDSSLSPINLSEFSYKYNQFGNIVEIAYNGTPLASYIWSYLGSHPIAEIKGIGYSAMVDSLPAGTRPDDLLMLSSVPQSVFTTIRDTFGNQDVTTIDYYWHIGAKSVTDASGTTTHYGYDDFGRLSSIRDYNRYFIKSFEYNYAH